MTNVARVRRQVDFLSADYDLALAAIGPSPGLAGVEYTGLPWSRPTSARRRAESLARIGLRLAGGYSAAYWLDQQVRTWREMLRDLLPVDAIVVNHLYALPLVMDLGEQIPVVFDAHEHWTSESASWTGLQRTSMRRAHEWIVDRYVPRTAGMSTVSRGIARDFADRAGVTPELVTNAPFFRPLEPSDVSRPIRLVHVGVADERRRLEDTIAAVRSLNGDFTLDLILAVDNAYRRRLEGMAAEDERIQVLPPVPTDDLVPFMNRYDVGLFLLPARFPNQVHVLPNKLFDYIQARLAVAIGPSREMEEIVREWDCGVVSETFTSESFAAALSELTPASVESMKRNADRAARVLSADANRQTVVSLVRTAIAGSPRRASG